MSNSVGTFNIIFSYLAFSGQGSPQGLKKYLAVYSGASDFSITGLPRNT
jgi:hypothetical protein